MKKLSHSPDAFFLTSVLSCLSVSVRKFLKVTPAEFEAAAAMEDLFFVELYRQKCVSTSQEKKDIFSLLQPAAQ